MKTENDKVSCGNPILESINPGNSDEWVGKHIVYDRANLLKLTYYSGFGDIYITDLKNAGARGKTCAQYSIKINDLDRKDNYSTYNFLDRAPLSEIFREIEALGWVKNEDGYYDETKEINIDGRNWYIYRHDITGVRVYSPFNLFEVYRPLKEIPKKWTLPHALRAIINQQYKYLKCNGIYTDDYAFDDSVNYQMGQISNNIKFAMDILENPSGWHCWTSSDGSVNINCHSFDTNEFMPMVERVA